LKLTIGATRNEIKGETKQRPKEKGQKDIPNYRRQSTEN
jgi:hypothetical protein